MNSENISDGDYFLVIRSFKQCTAINPSTMSHYLNSKINIDRLSIDDVFSFFPSWILFQRIRDLVQKRPKESLIISFLKTDFFISNHVRDAVCRYLIQITGYRIFNKGLAILFLNLFGDKIK